MKSDCYGGGFTALVINVWCVLAQLFYGPSLSSVDMRLMPTTSNSSNDPSDAVLSSACNISLAYFVELVMELIYCVSPIVFEHSSLCSSVHMQINAHKSTLVFVPANFLKKSRFVWLIM